MEEVVARRLFPIKNNDSTQVQALPLNCCFHPAGQVPVHANPLSLFMFEHSIFPVPPFLGLMSMFLNFKPVQGAPRLQ